MGGPSRHEGSSKLLTIGDAREATLAKLRLLAVAVVALMVMPTTSAHDGHGGDGVLDFGFTDVEHEDLNDKFQMEAEVLPSGGTVSVLPQSTWAASAASEVSFTIDPQTVFVDLTFSTLSAIDSVTAEVGFVDSNGDFQSEGATTIGAGSIVPGETTTFEVDVNQHSIDVGEYPAVRVDASILSGTPSAAQIDTGDSDVHYTDVPPPEAYPTPELSTLMLSTVGMLGLVGMARFRED